MISCLLSDSLKSVFYLLPAFVALERIIIQFNCETVWKAFSSLNSVHNIVFFISVFSMLLGITQNKMAEDPWCNGITQDCRGEQQKGKLIPAVLIKVD